MPDMNFSVPVPNSIRAPMKGPREPLQADGNLRYLDFIRLVQELWYEGHPDIPIKPVQSKTFTHYPVITYGLANRVAATNEPKPRYRDNPIDSTGQMYIVSGQRFNTTVTFTVITELDPELAEHIIEMFEDFMLEFTKVFKRLGLAEIVYARRLPDAEMIHENEDIESRAVAYMITEERLRQMTVERFQHIIINARLFLDQQAPTFIVEDGDDFLTVENHKFISGDGVTILMPIDPDDGMLPLPLHNDWIYLVGEVTEDTLTLTDLHGDPINLSGAGVGSIVRNRYYKADINIEDLYGGGE